MLAGLKWPSEPRIKRVPFPGTGGRGRQQSGPTDPPGEGSTLAA